MFDGAKKVITQDNHLSLVDVGAVNGVARYAGAQKGMLSQIGKAVAAENFSSYNATPVATYERINAATVRVDASQAREFKAMLESLGHRVYPNSRRRIIRPFPANPETNDPSLAKSVTIAENLKITQMAPVHDIARKLWGEPSRALGPVARLALRLSGAVIPQPLVAVIDTGIDEAHPALKGINAPKNATTGENKDDVGHGTWVTSMVRGYAPWLRNLTHYKTFVDGGANLDDILKALTMAANDGAIIMSNSWGSDEGDPASPDTQLVLKLAQEGRVMTFAAGNAGPGANTIGSPAIGDDPLLLSIPAADRNKKTASFSSRGPGSPKTEQGYPAKPTGPETVGFNTEGAWPTYMRDSDRTDPGYGPVKAISGTSMATPAAAGAIAHLCQLFGVTAVGPELKAIVNAVMTSAEKISKNHDAEGTGFLVAAEAYKILAKTMTPAAPNLAARLVLKALRLS